MNTPRTIAASVASITAAAALLVSAGAGTSVAGPATAGADTRAAAAVGGTGTASLSVAAKALLPGEVRHRYLLSGVNEVPYRYRLELRGRPMGIVRGVLRMDDHEGSQVLNVLAVQERGHVAVIFLDYRVKIPMISAAYRPGQVLFTLSGEGDSPSVGLRQWRVNKEIDEKRFLYRA